MFAGTAFCYLSALTITASKMIFLQKKHAHTMKKAYSWGPVLCVRLDNRMFLASEPRIL